jgi:alditol oxidase
VQQPLANWAGNVVFGPANYCEPASIAELAQLVSNAHRVRALGTGHSFNPIADGDGDLISVGALPKTVEVDREAMTATVSAGLRYAEVAKTLHAQGFALHNLGSLPHISVAGACATGTHGSGETNGSLSSAVRGVELVTAEGELVWLDRELDGETFRGAVVALGCLGVVTRLTLDIVEAFDVRQNVYDDLPFAELAEHLDEILGAAYSVSLFTDWRADTFNQVWRKHRIEADDDSKAEPEWFGARLATSSRHPLPDMPVENCTQQLGVAGPWHERLPHFRLEFRPSNGDELQSEYLLPRSHGYAAFEALRRIAHLFGPVLLASEIRTVAADDLWLSMANGHDSIAFHFTWMKDEPAVRPLLSLIEERLAPFGARPHWGKLFATSPDVLRTLYNNYADFEQLIRRFDPAGKFRNPFVDHYFPGI